MNTRHQEPAGDSAAHADTESRLAAIWTEFLGPVDVSPLSRFNDLGGHSLARVSLIARVYECFGVTLTMGEVLENETLQDLAARIERQSKADPSGEHRRIPVVDKQGPVVLSHTQEHLLVESLKAPEIPVYNEVATIRFNGSIEEDRLAKALNQVVARHDSFRTSYEWESGELWQTVHKQAPIELESTDFRAMAEGEREQLAEVHASEWASQPFDLRKPPLIRAIVGWYADDEARLFIVAHHLAIDAQTLFDVFFGDLWACYSALGNGQSPVLHELPIQHPDYAVWKKQISEAKIPDCIGFWKEKLKGFQPTSLPGDVGQSGTDYREGRRQVFHLKPDLSRKIKLTAQDLGTTPFVVLLAAFTTLLQRKTGTEDITLGSVTSDREHPDTQHLAGCLLNFIPLRMACPAKVSFTAVVNSVRETLDAAMLHQDVPLSAISDVLRNSGDLGRSPVYNIMFLQEPPLQQPDCEWSADQLSFHPGSSKLDLTFEMDEAGGAYFGRVEYRTSLYTQRFIEQLIRQYERILEQVVGDPEKSVSSLKLVNEKESQEVLKTFNRSDHSVKSHYRLHDFMEQRAKETPDAIALEYLDQSFTYGEVKRYSDNIASLLHREGALRNEVVAVVTRRSIWLPVALFGVLKSGAAYLPIDPDQPIERVHALLADSRAKIALVEASVDLGESASVTALDIAEAAQVTATEAPPDSAGPDDLAYVLYTSGSTGKPKGAMIEHRSIVNRLLWMASEYAFNESDVQLQKTPITFDVSLHELFLWSFVGARLAIPPPGAERDPAVLIQSIQSHRVTQIHFVPSMLDVFLTYLAAFGNEQTLFTLRHVHCSGEALPPSAVSKFQRLIGRPLGIGLHNLYGPTEAAVDVTYYDCAQFAGGASVPIGKPVWNTRMYVLDANLEPLPVGSTGELYIGGVQVGRGYLNQPDLTREAFVPDPFSEDEGARLYRTGDQARWLPDGNLEYLGRNDFQIKIRGVRIEPVEIEEAIREYPDITGAACIARKREDGEVILAGYYSCSIESDSGLEDRLWNHLKARLPSQMIPTSLTRLDSFPLNSSGKLDRKALPDPAIAKPASSQPRTTEEALLTEVWSSVLKVDGLGPEADFFEFGGDSIQAIQVISKVRQKGYLLNLRHVFECPSLADCAAEMKRIDSASEFETERLTQSRLVPIQNWFFQLGLHSPSHWNQSRLIEFKKSVDAVTLESALAAVIANHVSLRLRFRNTSEGWVQELDPDEHPIRLEVQTLDNAQNGTTCPIEQRCAELQASLDIQAGPLVGAVLFNSSHGQPDKLFICIHHLVTDGVSWQIILEDLEAAYSQIAGNSEPDLPEEITPYLNWPGLLEEYAGRQAGAFTTTNTASAHASITDLIRCRIGASENRFSSVREARRALNTTETTQLLMEVPSRFKTEINDILLTALALFFKTAGAREAVTLFLEGHGRESISDSADIGRTTGWFTSLFPITLSTSFVDTDAALKSIKEYLRTIPGKGLDYGLKYYFGEPNPNHPADRPEFLFNYLGNTDRHLSELSLIRKAVPLWNSECAAEGERPWTHEMLAWIEDGQLTVGWYFSEAMHDTESIIRFLESYMDSIRSVIRHCLAADTGGYTPSDFKSSGLSQDELDDLYSDFENING